MTSGGGGPGSRGAELLPVPPAVGTQRALPCRSFCVVDSLRPRRGAECFLEGAICSSREGRRRGGGSARPGAGLPGGGKHSRRALSRQLAGWPRLEPQALAQRPCLAELRESGRGSSCGRDRLLGLLPGGQGPVCGRAALELGSARTGLVSAGGEPGSPGGAPTAACASRSELRARAAGAAAEGTRGPFLPLPPQARCQLF